ncbi:hypothetical protein HDU92_000364 [Lobulomyces angularis]|nr:hypothetical protein HDU92_000364 [Lobulomyces angularis]
MRKCFFKPYTFKPRIRGFTVTTLSYEESSKFVPRTLFNYDRKLFWRPGHQVQALEKLERGIGNIDLLIEVRDARIPFSSTNKRLMATLGRRDRLIVFNKADLVSPNLRKPLIQSFKEYENQDVLFTSLKHDASIKKILHFAKAKSLNDPSRYPSVSVVIVGLPNVGKSSLLNALRRIGVKKKNVAAVAPFAGVTRAIQNRVKINDEPPVYLVDTPGIFDPHIVNPIQGLKIALTGGTKDRLVELVHVADFLLYKLNQRENCREKYVKFFDLRGPSNNINRVLLEIAEKKKLFLGGGPGKLEKDNIIIDVNNGYDLDKSAEIFIRSFREGEFGFLCLDELDEKSIKKWFEEETLEGDEDEDFIKKKLHQKKIITTKTVSAKAFRKKPRSFSSKKVTKFKNKKKYRK